MRAVICRTWGEVDGLTVEEFESFAPTVRTLRQFIAACTDLAGLVRDVMLPEPT